MENYKIYIKNLYSSLDQLYTSGILSEEERTKIKETAKIAENRIKNHEKPADKESLRVEETINMVLKIAINKPITPDFKKLVSNFASLITYWNDKIGGQSELKNSVSALERFANYHFTVLETTMVLRTLLLKMEQMQNFNPPAFELSKHYLKSLESSSVKKGSDVKKKNHH